MEIWIIWAIVVVVALILELTTQMLWALCLGIGALAGLIASVFGCTIMIQCIATAIGALVSFVLLVTVFRKKLGHDSKEKEARTGMDALLGRRAIVTHELKPGNLGRLRIDGDNWQFRGPDDNSVINRGEEVVVTGYDSIILQVNKTN